MNTDLFTEKAREAIVAAQQLAEERRNSQLEPEHVLLALLGQQDGVAPRLRLVLELAQTAKERLAEEGFDPVYGARPLRRAIQQEIVQPLALQLLQGTFHDGDRIVVEVEKGHFTFRRQAEVPPMATPVH